MDDEKYCYTSRESNQWTHHAYSSEKNIITTTPHGSTISVDFNDIWSPTSGGPSTISNSQSFVTLLSKSLPCMLQSFPRPEILHRALYIHDMWFYQVYSASYHLGHEPDMSFCWLLEISLSFLVIPPKLSEFSSKKLHRQLCMHYDHPSRGIRGCKFGEEGLYFEFSKTY